MTPAEAAVVLARAAIFDRRTVGEMEAHAWAKQLDGIDLADAVEAVDQHYRDTDRWLMPSHVRDHATVIARRRIGEQRQAARAAQIAAENGGDPDLAPVTSGGPAVPLAIEAAPLNARIDLYQEGRRAARERRREREDAERRAAEAKAARAAKRREVLAELAAIHPSRSDTAGASEATPDTATSVGGATHPDQRGVAS